MDKNNLIRSLPGKLDTSNSVLTLMNVYVHYDSGEDPDTI